MDVLLKTKHEAGERTTRPSSGNFDALKLTVSAKEDPGFGEGCLTPPSPRGGPNLEQQDDPHPATVSIHRRDTNLRRQHKTNMGF